MTRPRLSVGFFVALLAGCDGHAPGGAAERTAPQPIASASAQSDNGCFDRAGGDPAAIQTCADRAIRAAAERLPPSRDPAAPTDFAAALVALGDDAIERGVFGGGQSAQVMAARAGVRLAEARTALLSGAAAPPAGGPPAELGAEARAAWERSRASSCAGWPVADCPARYDALLDGYHPTSHERTPIVSDQGAGLPLPTCAEVRAAALFGAAMGDAFYRRYPRELADPQAVETLALDAPAIDNVVSYLVCVAGRTEFDPVVVDNGLALFASRRHGRAALARLSDMATAGDAQSSAARTFLTQVRGNLAGPGGD